MTMYCASHYTLSVAVRLANVGGMARVGLELVTKPEDEVVHCACERRIRVAPYQPQQFIPRDDVSGPFGEAVQDLELAIGQFQSLRTAVRFQPSEVDDGIAEAKLIDRWLGTAQDSMHPRQQFVEGKGLCHVVVSPERQSTDAILLAAACRQDDHRDAGGTIGERPADFEAVGAMRQHQVE